MTTIKNEKTSYLSFDASRMVNLDFSLKREILLAGSKGGYSSTSIAECNTRKQHGMLVVPTTEIGFDRMVLLSSLNEVIVQHGAAFNLGVNKYDGDNYYPQGHKYVREFSFDKSIRFVYRVGGVIFSKEKIFSEEKNIIYHKYTLIQAHSDTLIRFKPLLSFRKINELTSENSNANTSYDEVENGIKMQMYDNCPTLHMQFNKADVKYHHNPTWNKGVEYVEDMKTNTPYKEDLLSSGYFELPFRKGEPIIFAASDELIDLDGIDEDIERTLANKFSQDSFENCLKNAANQMIYKPTKNKAYITEGYPWGRLTARNQFMSMDGILLTQGKDDLYQLVIDSAIPEINNFMDKKETSKILEGIEEADVLLWFLRSLFRYASFNNEVFKKKYTKTVKHILAFILNNDHPNLHLTNNFMLRIDNQNLAGNWMDGIVDGQLVVHRNGLLVELNALWYNSLMLALDYDVFKEKDHLLTVAKVATTNLANVYEKYFLNNYGYLYDFVDVGIPNKILRPNMMFAVSNKHPLLDKATSRSIIDYATKELLGVKGIRTKSPKSSMYFPRFEGNHNEKAYAAFNGVARIWLIEPYLEAYMRVYGKSGVSFAHRILAGLESEMKEDCIGTLSALYDANMPTLGHGLTSSALDLAAILNVLVYKQKYIDNHNLSFWFQPNKEKKEEDN